MMRQKLVRRCQAGSAKEAEPKAMKKPISQPSPASQTANWGMQAFLQTTSATTANKPSFIFFAFKLIADFILSGAISN